MRNVLQKRAMLNRETYNANPTAALASPSKGNETRYALPPCEQRLALIVSTDDRWGLNVLLTISAKPTIAHTRWSRGRPRLTKLNGHTDADLSKDSDLEEQQTHFSDWKKVMMMVL